MQSYKFRIYPNKHQQERLEKSFGCVRFVWNYFLNLNIELYDSSKINRDKTSFLGFAKCSSRLPELKKINPWLNDSSAQSLQQVLKDLDITYSRFLKNKKGFPKFKSKINPKQSFRVVQNFSVVGNKIRFPKFQDGINARVHREILGGIKYMTISKTSSGKYFISITTDYEVKKQKLTENLIGIDLGIKDFAISSNGDKYRLNQVKENIPYLHKQLDKKQKGSKNKNKLRLKLVKKYEKIHNKKQDFQHKLSNNLCKENSLIAVEDLHIRGMVKNHCLAKSIASQSWGSFIDKLEYKAKRYGGEVVKTNRFYPSTKTCSCCGFINQNLTLKDRSWTCPRCHEVHDRDINAAKNILAQVLRETNNEKGGRNDRLKPVELPTLVGAVKQEVTCDSSLAESFLIGFLC